MMTNGNFHPLSPSYIDIHVTKMVAYRKNEPFTGLNG